MSMKILIVDDDINILQTMSDIFEEQTYSVTLINEGSKAIELTKNIFYNIAIINMAIKNINSLECMQNIKNSSPLTTIIGATENTTDISSYYSTSNIDIRYDKYIDEVLSKELFLLIKRPFDIKPIITKIVKFNSLKKETAKNSILFVEDNENVLESLIPLLENEGYTVKGVTTGLRAVQELRSRYYETVISDYKLPDISGLEVTKKIRQIDSSIPILFITAYADMDVVLNALKEQVVDFLTKPIDPEQLFASLKKTLIRKRKGTVL